jgi:hypothetical protein
MTNILMRPRLCVCVWEGELCVKWTISRLYDMNGMIY